MKKIFIIIFAVALGTMWYPLTVKAETREINISPFLQELEVAKGSSLQSSITITNTSEQELTVSIATKDFLAGDRGEPLFVPDAEFNELTFSLASWITIDGGSTVILGPKQSKDIVYHINPPANAEQGTHYGAVMFSYDSDRQLAGVGITQSVGTIVLVRYGEARSQGMMSFSVDHRVEFFNNKFRFTNVFTNTGNVHVKPKGEIQFKNIFGKVVGSSFINRDGDNVLPQSDRTFLADWNPGNFSFGPYRANVLVTYGKEKLELRSEEIIWVFPVQVLVLLFFVVTIILWFIIHGRHWHRRRVLKKHLGE